MTEGELKLYHNTFEAGRLQGMKDMEKIRKEILDLKKAHMIHFVSPESLIDVVIEVIDKYVSGVEE